MAKKSTSRKPKPRNPIPNLTLKNLFPSLVETRGEGVKAQVEAKANSITPQVVNNIRRRPASWRVDALPYSEKLATAAGIEFPLSRTDAAILHLVHKNLLNLRKQGKLYTKAQPGLRS